MTTDTWLKIRFGIALFVFLVATICLWVSVFSLLCGLDPLTHVFVIVVNLWSIFNVFPYLTNRTNI